MENRTFGRVVGVIHPLRMPPARTHARLGCVPQPLRLVARPNKDMERIVENGLAVYACKGHVAAIDYFAAQGVSLRTISRVLWQPDQRRHL